MTIQQALLAAIKKLKKSSSTSTHLDAEIILSFITNRPREYLHSYPEKKITPRQADNFQRLVKKRQRGLPMAYLTGHKEFYGLDFLVNKNVLIPRPETETLVEEAIKIARQMKKSINDKPLAVYDIGTGSGCIAITLTKFLPGIKIIATDISPVALSLARKNAQKHKILKKVKFYQGNLLAAISKRYWPADMIVANLPYLDKSELNNVRHEPSLALDGGKQGLELLEKIITDSKQSLAPEGVMLLEFSPTQTKAIDYFVERHLPGRRVIFIKDLSGRDRVAMIK